jgi:hypothetical protein
LGGGFGGGKFGVDPFVVAGVFQDLMAFQVLGVLFQID